MKQDKLINFSIDNYFRNPFRWGFIDVDNIGTRKRYGGIYYKTWNPFEDNDLVFIFIFFHYWKKKWIFKVSK